QFREPDGGDVERVVQVVTRESQDLRIGDEAALDDLRHPGAHLGGGEAVEQRQVTDHGPWLVERADEVLPGGQVDPGLAADCRVHHPQHGGGDADVGDAPQPAGCDEPGEVRGGAATQPDDDVVAGEAGLGQLVPAPREDTGGLGL